MNEIELYIYIYIYIYILEVYARRKSTLYKTKMQGLIFNDCCPLQLDIKKPTILRYEIKSSKIMNKSSKDSPSTENPSTLRWSGVSDLRSTPSTLNSPNARFSRFSDLRFSDPRILRFSDPLLKRKNLLGMGNVG